MKVLYITALFVFLISLFTLTTSRYVNNIGSASSKYLKNDPKSSIYYMDWCGRDIDPVEYDNLSERIQDLGDTFVRLIQSKLSEQDFNDFCKANQEECVRELINDVETGRFFAKRCNNASQDQINENAKRNLKACIAEKIRSRKQIYYT